MTLVVVDAHVHVYPCYDPATFFDRAWRNLVAAARAVRPGPFCGMLLLTESLRFDYFATLAAGGAPAPWRFDPTNEPHAVRAARDGGELVVVAGRQVATAEDLEVLTIGTRHRIADGQPIRAVLGEARVHAALRIVPWGAGKWLFGRGRLLSELLRSEAPQDFYLGDESARPAVWGTPRHFREADARGVRILPGTDPLPFTREVGRAGSFGFWLDAAFDAAHPALSLQQRLRDRGIALHPFGRLERPVPFLRNQVELQIRKRLRQLGVGR